VIVALLPLVAVTTAAAKAIDDDRARERARANAMPELTAPVPGAPGELGVQYSGPAAGTKAPATFKSAQHVCPHTGLAANLSRTFGLDAVDYTALRETAEESVGKIGRGIYALDPRHRAGLEIVEWSVGRLRHLIWNGYHEEAHDELFGMRHMASEVAYVNGDKFRRAVARLLWNCDDLRRSLANNTGSLIDYGERYRSKWPISTYRAESCVDEIANAHMAKKQRMR
jgi:hypothetical protein